MMMTMMMMIMMVMMVIWSRAASVLRI